MSEPIVVTDRVRVPARAITMRATRSSGPGGQNVNKVASRVELRIDVGEIEGLSHPARARLVALAGRRIDGEGRLLVTSQVTRDQSRNLADARTKVRVLIETAVAEPRARRPTRPSAAVKERRISEKKRRGERKRWRERPSLD